MSKHKKQEGTHPQKRYRQLVYQAAAHQAEGEVARMVALGLILAWASAAYELGRGSMLSMALIILPIAGIMWMVRLTLKKQRSEQKARDYWNDNLRGDVSARLFTWRVWGNP